MKKKIVFLTGTRADFGKLKSLMLNVEASPLFDLHVFATGMHLNRLYGGTVHELQKCGFENIYSYINHTGNQPLDQTLANTVTGFSNFIRLERPDLIVIHGDRVEALAGALVGALNNILVAHIEGGEVSGTIDESIRHAISKLSHTHFVANQTAAQRLLQMGEGTNNIWEIGSPDADIMLSESLPSHMQAKERYDIAFEDYSLLIYHPVTTEQENAHEHARAVIEAAVASGDNFIVIYPNNDPGSDLILTKYRELEYHPRFKLFPSIRFEHFLTLLKNASYLLGNSSCGIHEAPYYAVPTVNIGTRQQNRALNEDILHCDYDKKDILRTIMAAKSTTLSPIKLNGHGKSAEKFLGIISNPNFWQAPKQKSFIDLPMVA